MPHLRVSVLVFHMSIYTEFNIYLLHYLSPSTVMFCLPLQISKTVFTFPRLHIYQASIQLYHLPDSHHISAIFRLLHILYSLHLTFSPSACPALVLHQCLISLPNYQFHFAVFHILFPCSRYILLAPNLIELWSFINLITSMYLILSPCTCRLLPLACHCLRCSSCSLFPIPVTPS